MQIWLTSVQFFLWETRSPWRPCWTSHVDCPQYWQLLDPFKWKIHNQVFVYTYSLDNRTIARSSLLPGCLEEADLPCAVSYFRMFFYLFKGIQLGSSYLSWGKCPWCIPHKTQNSSSTWSEVEIPQRVPWRAPVGGTVSFGSFSAPPHSFIKHGCSCSNVTNVASHQSHWLTEALIMEE